MGGQANCVNLAGGAAEEEEEEDPSASEWGAGGGGGLGGTGMRAPAAPGPPLVSGEDDAPPPVGIDPTVGPPGEPPAAPPVVMPSDIPSAANILLNGLARLPASAELTSASSETGCEPPESFEARASRAAAAYPGRKTKQG